MSEVFSLLKERRFSDIRWSVDHNKTMGIQLIGYAKDQAITDNVMLERLR
jgi:hypothetical protein